MGNSLRLGDLHWTMGVGFKGFKYGLLLIIIALLAMALAACDGGETVSQPDGADAGGYPSIGSPDASAQPELIRMDGNLSFPQREEPVSYTHLTLPTSDLV